ncbi:MAG TPA: hypothetical protein VGO68_22090 [Pyrinomonadaceae bacterium]|jgi:hypothetical protein|nr:hypothetical protein [Pyrinomonadaceae bacterium]
MYSSSRSASLISVVLLCLLLLAGCGKLTKSLGELSQLQTDVAKEFKEKDVGVNLSNGTSLSITFVNSLLNSQEAEQRAIRARRTAQFVTKHYPSIANIEAIWIIFIRVQTRFVIVNYTESVGYFGFDRNGRPLPEEVPVTNEPTKLTQPTAEYDPALNQTDVIIREMQLEGDVNNGFSVVPHLTVPGDATGVRRSTSFPDAVMFDFSSASEKSMFPGAPKFTFLTDGKATFQTTEQFSTSKFEDKFSESVSIAVPYQAFRKLIGGKTLRLTIGDREYIFTEKQLQALREMTNYVRE